MAMNKYMKPRSIRREARNIGGRFRGGKLAPVMAVPFRESESGTISQKVTFELDPIPGRMLTPITAEVVSVYVPIPAMDALYDSGGDYPGSADVIREKLLSGVPLFSTEPENEITKRVGVVPRRVNGATEVSEVVTLAHNVAVNYLRRRKYVNASQLAWNNQSVTPALIGKTVLERLNGVLDPEDRVNGAVDFNIPQMDLPVKGLGSTDTSLYSARALGAVKETGGDAPAGDYLYDNGTKFAMLRDAATGYPVVNALFSGTTSQMSLTDFYQAERMDGLTREMRQLVDENPEFGEDIVTRWAHGLSVDVGKQPFVMYEKSVTFGMALRKAMDSVDLSATQSELYQEIDYTVPVPPTEFGGVVVTFAVVKPDEALASQPHPILSDSWSARNYVADEMAVDPVPVTIRELDGDCAQVDENTIALYVGNNHLMKTYVNYGFNRHLDPSTVAAKTAIWQLEVPMSVTPESVIYPENLDHYPFADQNAEVCTYTCETVAAVNTPIIFGPTPVEELAQIETDNVFNDA